MVEQLGLPRDDERVRAEHRDRCLACPSRHVIQDRAQRQRLEREAFLGALCVREQQQAAEQARQPLRLPGDVPEEPRSSVVVELYAGEEQLDRVCDRRQRRLQLVRGVGDEVALGTLAPLLGGDVGEDEHDAVSGSQ